MQIEHQCPQCGGPVILEETDRLLTCSFCKTRLFIQPQDYFRYCLSPSDPFLEDIIYVPYWRFRGMHFLCKTSGIKDGIIDKTFLAIRKKGLSATLGIRPQALKTRFLKPAEKMIFIKPGILFDRSSAETKKAITYELVRIPETRFVRGGRNGEYIEVSDTRLEVKEERVYIEAFVADTVSIVYAPFFTRNGKLFDAITNETIDSAIPPLSSMTPRTPRHFLETGRSISCPQSAPTADGTRSPKETAASCSARNAAAPGRRKAVTSNA